MMIGHQREILVQLGIDVWIPRDVLCQEIKQTSLWRDQAVSEIITQIEPVININTPILNKSVVEKPVIKNTAEQQIPAVELISTAIIDERTKLEIIAFSLQAVVLPHLIIMLDVSEISAEQQQLWANIQRAINAEFFELNWPFAMAEMNDGNGVENYIHGFIDAIKFEQKIVCLGHIPHFQNSMVMPLASLQDMLDSPLLKRRLWNFIQNKHLN